MRVATALLAGLAGLIAGQAPAHEDRSGTTPAATGECRRVETSIGGPSRIETVCRGADGSWRAMSETTPQGTLPPDFRGHVAYGGSFQGTVTTPGPAPRRLTIADLARSAGRTTSFSGGISVNLDINGNAVSGSYGGSGGIDSVTFTGTRSGSQCRLFSDRTGAAIEAECDSSHFAGTVTSSPQERRPSKIRFEASATSVVDAVQAEREQQARAAEAAQEQRRQVAERERSVATAAPSPRPHPAPSHQAPSSARHSGAERRTSGVWSGNGSPGPKSSADLRCLSVDSGSGPRTNYYTETGIPRASLGTVGYVFTNTCSRPIAVYYQVVDMGSAAAAALQGQSMPLVTIDSVVPAHGKLVLDCDASSYAGGGFGPETCMETTDGRDNP